MKALINILIFISILSCKSDTTNLDQPQQTKHIKYFGFALIDVFWDDPLDVEVKTNYINEIAHFTNTADILIVQPTE